MSDCDICKGELWVCENHLNTPWGDREGQCQCGAGKNCLCNPHGDFPEGTITVATVDPASVETWAH